MPRKVQVKCAIAGCYRRLKVTLAEREELRQVGRESNATAALICPVHVMATFNCEFDDIDVDVPLGELLVEVSKVTPRWRVMLTPLPGAAGELDSQPTPGWEDRVIQSIRDGSQLSGEFGRFQCAKAEGSGDPVVASGGRVSFGYDPANPGTGAFDYAHTLRIR